MHISAMELYALIHDLKEQWKQLRRVGRPGTAAKSDIRLTVRRGSLHAQRQYMFKEYTTDLNLELEGIYEFWQNIHCITWFS